jgi:ribosomal protein RSM22 (predicted rRNA methylase)
MGKARPYSMDFAGLLEGVSRKTLEARAKRISAAYRAQGTSVSIGDRMDALAYLVARYPATHAAAHAVFLRVAESVPDFYPKSLLDVGSGPGTLADAGCQAWPSLDDITLAEPNPVFESLARELWPAARILAGTLDEALPSAQLVTAGYVLAELPLARIPHAAQRLWRAADEMLVLIEPGTPQGFARIKVARRSLIGQGAHVAAPCTHGGDCPMTGSDWCHFSQRLTRSRDHMRVKAATVPFEDERYAYLALSRRPVEHLGKARIVRPPEELKPAITFTLCDSTGLHAERVPRRDKEKFRTARKKIWGDLF